MPASIVVSSILLTSDQLFWVEELTIGTGADLINYGWLQINEDGAWDVLAGTSLGEEGLEGVIPKGLVGGHVTIGLDAMFKAVELPAGVSNLATGLADVDGDTLTLGKKTLNTGRH